MSACMAGDVDQYARIVAATVVGSEQRAALLAQEGLQESGVSRLKQSVDAILQGPEGRMWTQRFSTAYKAALRGELPPPFEDGKGAARSVEPGIASADEPPSMSAAVSDAPGEGTLPLERPHAAAVKPYVPFVTSLDEPLGFEAFASYQADMTVWPEQAEEIFAHYGLTDRRTRRSVQATWAERLKDPSMMARWEALVDQLVAARRGGG